MLCYCSKVLCRHAMICLQLKSLTCGDVSSSMTNKSCKYQADMQSVCKAPGETKRFPFSTALLSGASLPVGDVGVIVCSNVHVSTFTFLPALGDDNCFADGDAGCVV